MAGAFARGPNSSDGRRGPRALAGASERRGEAERLARLGYALNERNRNERRPRRFRREVGQELAECAAVGVHRDAATVGVVLNVHLPGLADGAPRQLPFRDRYEHRRRHLDDGNGNERKAAEE